MMCCMGTPQWLDHGDAAAKTEDVAAEADGDDVEEVIEEDCIEDMWSVSAGPW
jgi:hypothetical protein